MENHQQFSLKWNNYLQHISGAFDSLRSSEDFVDVTLSCEGKKIKAHKMLLSACSNYFREIFKDNQCSHPVIVFHNIKYEDLSCLVTFMYQGQVNVEQEALQSFLNTAELLEVQGLTSPSGKNSKTEDEDESVSDVSSGGGKVNSPSTKRKRLNNQAPPDESKIAINSSLPEKVETILPDDQPADLETGEEMENEDSLPPTPQFLLHQENSLTHDNVEIYPDSQFYQPGKDEPPDINAVPDPSGSSNDYQDSLQVDNESGLQNISLRNISNMLDPGVKVCEVDPQGRNEHDAVPVGLVHLCKVCGKQFKHAGSLSMHKRLHSGDTHCSLCDKVFSRRYYLKVHLQLHHKLEKHEIDEMNL